MSGAIIYERVTKESEVARRWWQLPPLTQLMLEDGRRCLLIYAGTPGGAAGPDARDAVLRFLPHSYKANDALTLHTPDEAALASTNCSGDVEFHVSSSDWFAHQHQNDPRYNSVILHVVFYLDSTVPARRQDGTSIPNCSLLDLPAIAQAPLLWPCQQRPLPSIMLTNTLLYAGLLRFEEKSSRLGQELEESDLSLHMNLHAYDRCLLPALAEGLGYGRNQAFFRAAGRRMIGLPASIPEPFSQALYPPALDLRRLRILWMLIKRWQTTGAWNTLSPLLQLDSDVKSALAALRAAFHPLSRARTDIILCNVILPFATAVARREQNTHLATRARQLYLAFPRLASNRVTRLMSKQLHLPAEPAQACLQQGLHHLYASACQVKRCQDCLCGGKRL